MRLRYLGRQKFNHPRTGKHYLVRILFDGRLRYTLQHFPTATQADVYGNRLVERYQRLKQAADRLADEHMASKETGVPTLDFQVEGS